MTDLNNKDHVAVVQCHIVKERCSGYGCEHAFNERTGGFSQYPEDKAYRILNMTCGGCCGQAVHRKLSNLVRRLNDKEGIGKERIVVQLSSCITKDNFHGPPCLHLDYLKGLIAKLGVDVRDDTVISEKSERKRNEGLYRKQSDG